MIIGNFNRQNINVSVMLAGLPMELDQNAQWMSTSATRHDLHALLTQLSCVLTYRDLSPVVPVQQVSGARVFQNVALE